MSTNQPLSTHRSKLLLSFAAACLLFSLLLTGIVRQHGSDGVDLAIMQAVYSLRSPILTMLLKGITFFGDRGLVAVAILATISLVVRRQWHQTLWFSLLVGTGATVNAVLKVLIARPRPLLSVILGESDFSFPSGHAMDSAIMYGAIAYLLFQTMPRRHPQSKIVFLIALMVGMIGFSRIYLGVHYPSDVLGGYLFGTAWLLLGIVAYEY